MTDVDAIFGSIMQTSVQLLAAGCARRLPGSIRLLDLRRNGLEWQLIIIMRVNSDCNALSACGANVHFTITICEP